jgi:predicted  nucleic acid-binding Zn-ribbon protein
MTAFDDLLVVQELDTTTDQLRHRLATLPERTALAAAVDARDALTARLEDAEGRRAAVRREQKRIEDEVSSVEDKATHVNGQLYGGTITAPKELEALQHELDGLHARQRDLEDHVIEQMELAEPIDEELTSLAEELETAEQRVTVATAELDAAAAETNAELEAVLARRADTVTAVPADLLERYEGIRTRADGVGAARLVGNRCDGCHLAIPSAEAEEIRRAPADEIVMCPECLRILVR